MDKDVLYNKIEIIERCLIRIKEVYADDQKNLEDYTKQDSIVLNIQRAIEASIDIAMHIVSEKKLGIPKVVEMLLRFWNIIKLSITKY